MTDFPDLTDDIEDLELGTGYSLLCKNRPANMRGYSTGVVAIAFRKSRISFKPLELPGNDYEMLFAEGTLPLFTRKFIAICLYRPPSMPAALAAACMTFLVDALLEIKSRYKDPFICIPGDFNTHQIESYLEDYPDLSLLVTGPTRKEKTPDLIFTNFPLQIIESGLTAPLECDLETGASSDHRVVYCTAELKRFQAYEWITYTYVGQTGERNLLFKDSINSQDWNTIFKAVSSDEKALLYQLLIAEAMAKCYPVVTFKKKSTDDPWICLLYTSPSPRDS